MLDVIALWTTYVSIPGAVPADQCYHEYRHYVHESSENETIDKKIISYQKCNARRLRIGSDNLYALVIQAIIAIACRSMKGLSTFFWIGTAMAGLGILANNYLYKNLQSKIDELIKQQRIIHNQARGA